MMRDLRSAETREKEKREFAKRRAKEKALDEIVRTDRAKAGGWRPIKEIPFEAYGESWSEHGTILVSDGARVVVATISKRFGRPVKQIEPPTYALTDHGPMVVGGKYEEYDHPDWWFEWKFTDELSSDHEMWGKDEVDFVPTHYMPLPLPPND